MGITIHRYACRNAPTTESMLPPNPVGAKIIDGVTPSGKMARGWVEYARPLTYKEMVDFHLSHLHSEFIAHGMYEGSFPWTDQRTVISEVEKL